MSVGNNRGEVPTPAKTKSLEMSLASRFVTCKYGHTQHSFVYAQFHIHSRGFIVPIQCHSQKQLKGRDLKFNHAVRL